MKTQTQYDNSTKERIVAQHLNGQPISELSSQYDISRSTLYYWVQKYQTQPLNTSLDTSITYKNYLDLKRHTEKLEETLAVIQAAGCGTAAPQKEKLDVLEKLYEEGKFSVRSLCEALDVPRGTFYNHIFRKKDVTAYDKRREEIREHIKSVFEESNQTYGAQKICAVLAERGIRTTKPYVANLMNEMGLRSVAMDSKKEYRKRINATKKRNVLQRQFNVTEPNRAWVSDVTCFKIKDKYYYICAIIDLFSRKIVAYKISERNSTYLITSTFKMAFDIRNHPQQLIFHSDQGVQYKSKSFRKLLLANNVVQSFSKSGSPHDNAVAESFFSSMKKEELYRYNYRSEKEFRNSVDNYIVRYNTKRPHSTLAHKTPEQFEAIFYAKEDTI